MMKRIAFVLAVASGLVGWSPVGPNSGVASAAQGAGPFLPEAAPPPALAPGPAWGDGPPPFFPGRPPPAGFGEPGGPGRFNGPPFLGERRFLVPQFDRNGDRRLDTAERKAAREFLATERAEGRGRRGPGPGPRFGGRGENKVPPQPGRKRSLADVKLFPREPLYDPATLRTFFLEFESADWEQELSDFFHTDVEVPARLTVDGQVFAEVGVHFRGASSFFMIGEGRKRSLNLSLDFVHEGQHFHGVRTFNLLNGHEDPTFLRTVLYHQIARDYLPAPRANFVRVVINGESWGVYVSQEQFNRDFVKEWFGTTKGARWKVPGRPRGRGNLAHLGADPASYKGVYEIKSKDDPSSWAALIRLCKVLNQTPPGELEAALAPLLDVDGALKFLALENALINNDGYWVRASDYCLYQDEKGRFHVIPYDANETFTLAGGPGFGPGPGGPRFWGPPGGPGSGPGFAPPRNRAAGSTDRIAPAGRDRRTSLPGVELDPLVAAANPDRPLISKLLAIPALRARYLGYVRDIAERWLDWNKLGPLARQYHSLIAADVQADTRKPHSDEEFLSGLEGDPAESTPRGPRPRISLKRFAEQRRAYLLNHAEVKKASVPPPKKSSS